MMLSYTAPHPCWNHAKSTQLAFDKGIARRKHTNRIQPIHGDSKKCDIAGPSHHSHLGSGISVVADAEHVRVEVSGIFFLKKIFIIGEDMR